MTDKEAKQLAERTHAILKSNPALDLLVDIAHSTPRGAPNALFHGQLILAVFDIIGSNIEKFEKLSEPLTGPISSGTPCSFNLDEPSKVIPL